jgi:hypothetical protein
MGLEQLDEAGLLFGEQRTLPLPDRRLRSLVLLQLHLDSLRLLLRKKWTAEKKSVKER